MYSRYYDIILCDSSCLGGGQVLRQRTLDISINRGRLVGHLAALRCDVYGQVISLFYIKEYSNISSEDFDDDFNTEHHLLNAHRSMI